MPILGVDLLLCLSNPFLPLLYLPMLHSPCTYPGSHVRMTQFSVLQNGKSYVHGYIHVNLKRQQSRISNATHKNQKQRARNKRTQKNIAKKGGLNNKFYSPIFSPSLFRRRNDRSLPAR